MARPFFFFVTPAKAGAHLPTPVTCCAGTRWVPAFAGMTEVRDGGVQ